MHILTCRKGGFPAVWHNELCNILSEVSTKVTTEPCLPALTGEWLSRAANKQRNAYLDIRARGFWDGMQEALFDVRVFHPLVQSFRSQKLFSIYCP